MLLYRLLHLLALHSERDTEPVVYLGINVNRHRAAQDERSVEITLTADGMALKEKAAQVPRHMQGCVHLTPEERIQLQHLLGKLLNGLTSEE
jgi:DNA-binding MarR family transcriptional regulator